MAAPKSELEVDRYAATPAWMLWAVFTSFALHGVAYAGLSDTRSTPRKPPPNSVMAFEVMAPTAPEPLPAVEEEEPAPPERVVVARAAEPQLREPERSREPPSEPAAETVDMSGLTLTNDQGVGFAMPAGNGLARDGALRVPASLGRERPVVVARQPKPEVGPGLVPISDLSSRPAPPALDGALERNYPDEARRRGLGGNAMVRLRIEPDGIVRNVTPLNESFPGFGEACRRTLRGSRWSAPRDREGRAVATEVRYTCHFVVTR
jgi:periplasmic protein TonB